MDIRALEWPEHATRAAAPSGSSQPRSDLDGHLLRGRLHLAKGESTEAIQDLQKVLKLEPGLAVARHQLALAQLQAWHLQQARADLKEAAALDPDLVDSVLLLAELDIQAGVLQPAIERLEALLARQPGAVAAWVLLGSAHLARGDGQRGAEAYRKVMALAPRDPRGPHLVGLALRVDDHQKARNFRPAGNGSLAVGQRLLTILQYGCYRRARRRLDMSKLIVELPEEIHRELKRKATHERRTIKGVVTDLVEGYLSLGREDTARPAETGLCGGWKDTRTAAEILRDIKSRRKWFRGRKARRG